MPQRHTIEVGIVVKDDGSVVVEKFNDQLERTDEELKKAEQAGSKFGKSFDSFVQGAYQRAGQMATEFLSSLPGQIVELGKLGAQAQAAELRFERFAGGAEQAEEFLQAFATATDGTVDKMGAMSSAARLLQMGLVSDADEMETVAALATKLGDQTQGATDRIADFSALLANQSIPRLDNFGISSGRVRNRIAELQKATADMSREEAFKIAVMEEGAKSLEKLGDTSELAQVKIDKVTSAVSDAKTGLGELIIGMVEGAGSVDDFAARIRMLPDTLARVAMLAEAGTAAWTAWKNNIFDVDGATKVFDNTLKVLVASQTDFKVASEEVRFAYTLQADAAEDVESATEDVTKELNSYTSISFRAEDATDAHIKSQSELEFTILQTNDRRHRQRKPDDERVEQCIISGGDAVYRLFPRCGRKRRGVRACTRRAGIRPHHQDGGDPQAWANLISCDR
jgi:hypothetical protein